MYITITIEADGKRFDVSVDGRQTAAAAFSILRERGLVGGEEAPRAFKSLLLGEWISADAQLSEAGVVSGDCLTAEA